ncbi:MAG: ketoacyl-ACP synthase III [Alphaproteobacteria bacterium]|nr:ketoacyl-ACP synthase III [Alphaproteobacteria bacterium]
MRRSVALGCGAYLPERRMTNDDIARIVDTDDQWIVERTGIRERRIAAVGERTSDLATRAAEAALAAAGIGASDLDLIVLATATPDDTFPATATKVQAALGMRRGAAFDVQAVCSGFVYALAVADSMLRCGQAATALVIGAETFSRILDWTDRSTCVLFGDGAGALVLGVGEGQGDKRDRGVLSSHLHSDGRYHDLLYVDGGPSSGAAVGHLRMAGRDVFKHAVTNLSAVVEEALTANGLVLDEVDWLVPHQANRRILDSTARKIGIPAEKVIVTVDRHANTSAASIPLALAAGVADGRIQRGHLLLLEAMGGGFTWGANLLRW